VIGFCVLLSQKYQKIKRRKMTSLPVDSTTWQCITAGLEAKPAMMLLDH
jgi:hypothetical protein